MAVMIVRYRDGDELHWGSVADEAPSKAADHVSVIPLDLDAKTTAELIANYDDGGFDLSADPMSVAATDLVSPVTSDANLICQGLNYSDHASEAQHTKRKANLFFAKASSSITGPYGPIERPDDVQLLDYECEFGIVFRATPERGVTPDAAGLGRAIAGVVLANELSARDVQFAASFFQWYQGKSYRTFCPLGPVLYLLDPDEVAETLAALEIKLWVNGELRQSASSSQLIYGPAETLGQLSKVIDFKPGDVILTGTPGGVTSPATPRLVEILKEHLLDDSTRKEALLEEWGKGRPFLQPGDVVTATLRDTRTGRDLGGLENRVVDV